MFFILDPLDAISEAPTEAIYPGDFLIARKSQTLPKVPRKVTLSRTWRGHSKSESRWTPLILGTISRPPIRMHVASSFRSFERASEMNTESLQLLEVSRSMLFSKFHR